MYNQKFNKSGLPNDPVITNRGTAYIVFEEHADAEAAIAHMHEAQLDGTMISVSIVLPRRKPSRSPTPVRRSAPSFERRDYHGATRSYQEGPPPSYPGGTRYRSPPRRSPLEDATTVGLHVRIHGIEMPMHIGHVRIQDHGHDRGLDRADQGLYPTHLARASAALLENIERLGAGITTLHPEEGEDEVQVTLAIRAIATVVVVAAE